MATPKGPRTRVRHATGAEWTALDPTLKHGELGFDETAKKLKIGDGATVWTALDYLGSSDYTAPGSDAFFNNITALGDLVVHGAAMISGALSALSLFGTLAFGLSPGAHLSGATFDNTADVTWVTDATELNTASTIIARDADGAFAAGIASLDGAIIGTDPAGADTDELVRINGSAAGTGIGMYAAGTHIIPFVSLGSSRGTIGAPTALLSGDALGTFAGWGYDGASWRGGGGPHFQMEPNAAENFDATHHGTEAYLRLTPIGAFGYDFPMSSWRFGSPSRFGYGQHLQGLAYGALVVFEGFRFNGTPSEFGGAETGVVANDVLVTFSGAGRDSTGSNSGLQGGLHVVANATWSGTDHSTQVHLRTTPSGSTTVATRWLVTAGGNFQPLVDNASNLGGTSNRASSVFAYTGDFATALTTLGGLTIGPDTVRGRFFRSAADVITLTSNWTTAGAQDDAAKTSWFMSLSTSTDRFLIRRAPAGGALQTLLNIGPTFLSLGEDAMTDYTINVNAATATLRDLRWQTVSVNRWILRTNNTAEAGSNAGSDFQILARKDDGTANVVVLQLTRSSGFAAFGAALQTAGTYTATSGFGSAGFNVAPTITAAGGVVRGVHVNPVLVAAANGDAMTGMRIEPTNTPGVLTGLLRTQLILGAMDVSGFTSPADPISLDIRASTGTGAANAYAIKFGAGPSGATANFLLHATNYRLTSAGAESLGSSLTWITDNAADLGASGSGRARTGYFGTSVVSPIYLSGANQVVGARVTGYAAMTGAGNKGTVYDVATITLGQLAARVAQLQADLTTHGLIGA